MNVNFSDRGKLKSIELIEFMMRDETKQAASVIIDEFLNQLPFEVDIKDRTKQGDAFFLEFYSYGRESILASVKINNPPFKQRGIL